MQDELDKQVIFKLGQIESEVRALSHAITENFKVLADRIDEKDKEVSKDISALNARVDVNDKEIQQLRDWKNRAVAAAAVISGLWIVLGPTIQSSIVGIF